MTASQPTDDGRGNDTGNGNGTPPTETTAPPLADSTPFPIACLCLNVVVETRALDDLAKRAAKGPTAFTQGKRERVYLPPGAESIKHAQMATFKRTTPFDRRTREATEEAAEVKADAPAPEAWRKCWVCGVRLYLAHDRVPSDVAPSNVWVDVDLTDGVLYGEALEKKQAETPLPFSGLVLDIPSSSTFGRQPTAVDPVGGIKDQTPVLPPVPDPFFLPPPFIPRHPVLREMCKLAVERLHEKHSEIDRDIRQYIATRTGDMRAVQAQVRAEVEALWDRYSDGPGAGDETTRRRGSGSAGARERSASPAILRQSFDGGDRRPSTTTTRRSTSRPRERTRERIPTTELDRPSGVVPSPPVLFTGQHNAHTAQAAASLLSASLSANAFHAPTHRMRKEPDVANIDEIVKAASAEPGLSKEVAMSFAFSAMDEHAAAMGRGRRERSRTLERALETAEVEQEDAEKGVDSWISLERADAARRAKRDTAGMAVPTTVKEAEAEVLEREHEDDEEKKETANGATKERKARVQFAEPPKEELRHDQNSGRGRDDDDDNGAVFEFDTDAPAEPVVLPPKDANERRMRNVVEENLSRTLAADAPSHRAAWRRLQSREGMSSVLRRHQATDDEDDEEGPPVESLARSMPVTIVMPKRDGPVQFKTSLTDRGGVVVPNLLHAMRRGSAQTSSGEATPPVGLRAPRNSIAIVGSMRGGRRGSRSGERDREAVKTYGADPGAVFEALAEVAVDSDDEDSDQFVPPHVLAARRDERPGPGWRSLATS
ncbi:hypothetical protein CcaverHIS002_0210970 [Cutaneotrichosporon cavernicola]|uniref:Uncharacterized protein n=1 Tax=Cutaneotrichosporon cavernicola TaxID=279322 RepID=A0AA48L1J2_9TREE|nr:uncharacterized protein CcaverHIS019_0210970 [Cutaneotrichosporon cavernicola]BEI81937.1 hypothetical protein CcaverHIS002_0210970 [Cutaneotrichosporon cavernicola]BEI89735.1 hypothetical protein CcaverHIS019_0210970 [Cutaneotrichosporon cavernicola]BEI97506.1 hypothetical protein CcaverHIS631_0210950 [Cutaneotrichosporon cavernicola]BEJ05284.1 hypothetical protein CcaverHIS641_0211010 [Cutaneotrichosporon cavernicola]